ncbi:MAG: Mur ligase family protein [Desulfovibrionaceae bacterium]|nr:Mur ligase family protein [Desulfovibrionaceae bacterium]
MSADFPKGLTGRINYLAKRYEAKSYLEIGRLRGKNFSEVAVPKKLAVSPHADFTEANPAAGILFCKMSSDAFFTQMAFPGSRTASLVTSIFGKPSFDIIFINGTHTFSQSFRDFENSMRYAHNKTLFILNATVPCDPYSSIPDENLSVKYRRMAGIAVNFWHGDVFKTVLAIHDKYQQYSYCTIASGASQTIIWKSEDSLRKLLFSSLDEINKLDYFGLLHHAGAMMPVREDQIFDFIGKTLNPLEHRDAETWKKLFYVKVTTTREMELVSLAENKKPSMESADVPREEAPVWTPEILAEATGGEWIIPSPADWSAVGMCAWWESFKPGDMLMARSAEEKRGLSRKAAQKLAADAAGIICTDPDPWVNSGLPVLKVNGISDAVFALAATARGLFRGKVVAVTGTSGKTTTVALIAYLLARYGTVSQTQLNANTFYGMAWNMAAMDLTSRWWVLELAVPEMRNSASLAGPDVAVALNVSAGHLKYWRTVKNLAFYKSKIFSGLRPGGHAVINHDMEMFDLFKEEALQKTEKIITFGERANSTLRLVKCINDDMEFIYNDKQYLVKLPGYGHYTAMNALAALGVLLAFGLPHEKSCADIASLPPIAGRGMRHKIIFENKEITIIDESYNANPASVRATLLAFSEERHRKSSRVLILGDMLELGEGSVAYHRELEEHVRKADPDRVLLCGEEMLNLWETISDDYSGRWYADAVGLIRDISNWIADNDVILIKGSHGAGLHKLAGYFLRRK